jgi:hypothetical protein
MSRTAMRALRDAAPSSVASVRGHARYRGAYLAAGIAVAFLLLSTQAFGQVVSGNHANGPAKQRPNATSDQPPSPQPLTTSSSQASDQRQKPANDSNPQDSKTAHDGSGFWNAKITDWAIVFLTFGLLVAGAVQVTVYCLQTRIMRRALLATVRSNIVARRAAKAAENAVGKSDEILKHSEKSSERELRAYVFVHRTDMEREKKTRLNVPGSSVPITTKQLTGRVSYSYENTGKTPAKNVQVAARAAWIKSGETLDITNVGSFRLIGPLGPEARFSDDLIPEGPTFPPSHIEGVANDQTHELHLWGRINYHDEFSRERRWTTFHCYIGGAVGYDKTLHAVEPGNDYR